MYRSIEEFFEWTQETEKELFEQLEHDHPSIAKNLKPDFEEYLRVRKQLFEVKKGKLKEEDIRGTIPNNRWLGIAKMVGKVAQEELYKRGILSRPS